MLSAGVARSLTHRVATGIPFLAAGDHDVENDDQLAHAGDQGNLCLFADQATIEGLEHRVVPGRSSRASHVEQIADLAASTLDLALAPPFTAVVIVRRDSGKAEMASLLTWPNSGMAAMRPAEVILPSPARSR
jgi:hypothetical protein